MSNFDFKINEEPVSDDKIRQYQDFDHLIRSHNIKSNRPYRRSGDVPIHRMKWVVIGFMTLCALALFGGILGFFVASDLMNKETVPVEKTVEQKIEQQELDTEKEKLEPVKKNQ